MDKLKEEVLPEIDLLLYLEMFYWTFPAQCVGKKIFLSVWILEMQKIVKTSTGFDVTFKFGNHIQDFLFLQCGNVEHSKSSVTIFNATN